MASHNVRGGREHYAPCGARPYPGGHRVVAEALRRRSVSRPSWPFGGRWCAVAHDGSGADERTGDDEHGRASRFPGPGDREARPGLERHGPGHRLVRGVPGVPRRHDRQRRVPEHPRVVPGLHDQQPVVDPQRLQHRLRGVPRPVRPDDRPDRPAPRVRLGRAGLHRRLGVCALSPSVAFLIGARVVQALGAAMLVPASLALVVAAFPRRAPDARGRAVGRVGSPGVRASARRSAACSSQLGDWRWAFLVNLPFGIAAWVMARRSLVESRAPGRRTPAGPRRCGAVRPRARAAHPRDRPGRRLGLDQLGRDRLLRRLGAAAGRLRAQLPAPPLAAARPRAAQGPRLQGRQRRDDRGRAWASTPTC